MDLNSRFFWGILLTFSILLLQGCLTESSDPSYSDFTSNRIPVALPDTIDVDVYRIEISSDSTETFIYYEKPGTDGLFISVPSDQPTQISVEGFKNELLVYSGKATIPAGQKDAVLLQSTTPIIVDTPITPAQISVINYEILSDSTILLKWETAAQASVYNIYRSNEENGVYSLISTVTETTFSTTINTGNTYYFKVSVKIKDKESPLSSAVKLHIDKLTLQAPKGVTAVQRDSGAIQITFQSVQGASGYIIYKGNSALTTQPIDTISTILYTDVNAGEPATYYYKVVALGTNQQSVPSETVSITIKKSLPSTPSGLIATSPTATSVNLQFNSATNATAYIIYRGLSATALNSIDTITTTSFDDKNLLQNTTYYYAVAATGGAEKSPLSTVVSIKTGALVPSTPTGLVATAQSATAILLKFNAVSNAESYAIFRGASENSLVAIDTVTETSFTSSSLQSGATYYFAVAAINKEGSSSRSQTVSAKTTQSVPATPTGLTVSAVSTSSIQIQFNTVSEATGYIIYRGTSSGSLIPVDTITTGSLTDQNLQSATTYYYAVAAYNSAGVSQRSATSSVATKDAPPATPSGLKVSAVTANSITIQFNSVTGATGYKIYSSTNNSTYTVLATITTTTYTHTGLAAATTRYYKVSSIKGTTESAQSASVSGSTQANVTKKAVVTTSKCVGCGDCRVCPTGALTIVNRKAVIDASKCDGCGKCIARCRFGALSLQ